MDDSPVKGLTSSMSIKNVGNNENDESGSLELEKSREVVRKHYMSPTVSAAKKAAALVPRKKILADRNEGFTFRNSPKSLIGSACSIRSNRSSDNDCDDDQNSFSGDSVLEKKVLAERFEGFTFASSPKPLIGSARSIRLCCSSDNNCDDDENSFEGDTVLEKKPYDPLTNYLSPRPKFLRYNPNKKRRIFLCGEDEIGKMKDGLGFVSTSSSFEFQKVVKEEEFEEGALKKGDEELEMTEGDCNVEEMEEAEESEEFEEEEEEKCWSLLGLMKFLLVLGSLFLSTAFIYSMESADPLLTQEAVGDFRGGFVNQSNIHEEFVSRKEHVISEFEVMDGKREESHLSLLHMVAQNDMVDNEFAEVGISKDNWNGNGMWDSISILPELTIEKFEDVDSDGLMRKAEASETLPWAEPDESESNTDVEVVHGEAEAVDSRENECIRNHEIESTEEAFDQVQSAETVEVYESFQKDLFSEMEPITDTLPWAEPKESEGNTKCEVVHSETEDLDFKVNECLSNQEIESTEAFDQVQSDETVEVFKSFQEDLFSEIELSTELNAENVMMESEEIKLQPEVLVLAGLLSVAAALGFLYRSRKRKIGKSVSFPTQKNNGKESSLPMETQHQNAEPVIAAHQIHNSNAICGVKEEKMKKVESIVSPSTTPFFPMKGITEEFSKQSQAPIVELLGELVIGEANGSFKSNKKKRVLDSEVKNGSNHLFTETVISHSKAPLVQDQMYSLQLELSNALDSSSQKKKSVSKKKEGKGEELSMASATPVRRSSRIRQKAISPR
ncbi:hypothetical protein POM88_051598 [Heracleum sosnowskyi]|uniref:Uncharacterized protein n=1 Tax=Heracleum sosnowskyi TaxID=360622 RepID=A0AAD8GZT2_9APIA|nr:hypothetical protein POM88_051598 [Heracleum sosnowskyi]